MVVSLCPETFSRFVSSSFLVFLDSLSKPPRVVNIRFELGSLVCYKHANTLQPDICVGVANFIFSYKIVGWFLNTNAVVSVRFLFLYQSYFLFYSYWNFVPLGMFVLFLLFLFYSCYLYFIFVISAVFFVFLLYSYYCCFLSKVNLSQTTQVYIWMSCTIINLIDNI